MATARLQLQSVIDGTPSMIYACDLEARFVFVNAALATLLKSTPAQMIGRRRHEFMPQADADAHEANDREVMAAGRAVEFEERSELPGRSITWLSTKFPLRDGQGRIYAVAGIVTDITERKEIEEALRESEERFRLMGDTIPFGAWMADAQGRNIYISPLFLELIGKTFEEVKEFGWMDKMPPEDVEPVMRRWMECVRTGQDWEAELRFPSPDGRWHTILSRGKPVRNSQGQVQAWVGINLDITERKRAEEELRTSEQRFRAAVDHFPSLFVLYDADRRITYINVAGLAVGGRPASDFLGKRDEEVWSPEVTRNYLPQLLRAYETKTTQKFEMSVTLPSGASYTQIVTYVPLLDEQGRVRQALGITHDITDRKQTEEELQAAKLSAEQARTIAESASKAKDQFIAVLSHELRTPLTPAVAALSMLRRDVRLPHDVREDLEMISNNIDLEVRLIADLLDASRIISGKLHLEKRLIDVADAIREAARIVSGDMDARGQTLSIDTPGAPYLTFGDAARLQQVFWKCYGTAADIEKSKTAGFAEHMTKPLASVDLLKAAIARLGLGGQQPDHRT